MYPTDLLFIADIIDILAAGFKSDSHLLRHEVAYVLGQLGDAKANSLLFDILSNMDEHCMVRHEAGEAIGAIGSEEYISLLEPFLQDPLREIRETVELAIKNIKEKVESEKNGSIVEKKKNARRDEEFQSIDPAPAYDINTPLDKIRTIYLNQEEDLYKRYKAMFTLRNKASRLADKNALEVLCEGFREEEGALFKHEIAFVLGQLQKLETSDCLEKVLRNGREHEMVRHEAAEALGSISDPKSLELLEEFQKDEAPAVRDSCIVAVDMHQYWSQYNTTSDQ